MRTSRKSSAWSLEYSKAAFRLLKKLPQQIQTEIVLGLEQIVFVRHDPWYQGKPLQGSNKGYWRYRFGEYRVICKIEQQQVKVLVLSVGHRRDIYR